MITNGCVCCWVLSVDLPYKTELVNRGFAVLLGSDQGNWLILIRNIARMRRIWGLEWQFWYQKSGAKETLSRCPEQIDIISQAMFGT